MTPHPPPQARAVAAAGGLVLVGAGGLAREVVEAAPAPVAGLLDDDPAKAGTAVAGIPVLGPSSLAGSLDPSVRFVAAVANVRDPGRRRRLVDRVGLPEDRWGTVVHPAAVLARSTSVGAGSMLLAGVVATADVTIGRHVAIMPACVLTHDVVLGDGCTLASGVHLAGAVHVGADAYLGAGALVRENLTIGAGAVIGMGAVVTRDVPPGETWLGTPARPHP